MGRLLTIIGIIMTLNTQAQMTWVKAANSGCYFHTGASSVFTWSGSCRDGYCDGYGTIQWLGEDGTSDGRFVGNLSKGMAEGYATQYHANGNKWYEGYWRNDKKNGRGTMYLEDGSVAFQGNFIDDNIEGYALLNYSATEVARYVMQKVFDGGTNLRSELIKFTDNEIRIRIVFNGDIVETNVYRMTLVIRNVAPFVDFINYNSNAESYLKLKVTATIANGIYDLFNSNKN